MSLLAASLAAALAVQAPAFRDAPHCRDGAQNELNHCAWFEYRQAEAAMNKQWSKTAALMKRLDDEYPPNEVMGRSSSFEALLKGQRAWLQFRDAFCPVLGATGGSMASMLIGYCMRDVTLERTKQLQSLMLHPATGNPYFEDQ